jgi:hypothetical protein
LSGGHSGIGAGLSFGLGGGFKQSGLSTGHTGIGPPLHMAEQQVSNTMATHATCLVSFFIRLS